MNETSLGSEKISTLFLKIVLPSMISMVIIGLQGMIDGLFLGNYVSSNAMASVNLAQPFNQSTSAITFVLSIGASAYIGRLLGANDTKTARTVFKTAFLTILLTGVAIFFSGQFFHEQIAELLGANEILMEETAQYIKISSIFLPFFQVYILCSFMNRLLGKPHLFILGTVLSILANICFNFLFIAHLEMGVLGAAIATGLSYLVGFVVNFPTMFNKNAQINVFTGSFSFSFLLKMSYNGASEGITSISTALTTLIFNLTFMHFYGESGVAAYTIISYLAQVGTLLIFGVVDGINPIISYNFGANKKNRVKEVVFIAFVLNLVIGMFTYAIIFFCGESLIALFSDDAALISLTYSGAKLYGTLFFVCGVNILASSYFTAIGEAFNSILISSSRGIIFIILGIFVLPSLFQVTGVWLVAPFADFVTLLLTFVLRKKNTPLKITETQS